MLQEINLSYRELESLVDTSKKFYNVYPRTEVPESFLIIHVDDHKEFDPDFLPYLKYINLINVNTNNLKLSNIDLRETNLHFNPQLIHNKDLSYTKVNNDNIRGPLDGCILNGADITEEDFPVGLDSAYIDKDTKIR